MTIVYSCLCFVSISRGLMTKPIGFLRVPPLKFVEQIVWFFSFLISLLFGPFFSVYICLWFYLLQFNCNNGYFSGTSFVVSLKVNKYILILLILILLKNKTDTILKSLPSSLKTCVSYLPNLAWQKIYLKGDICQSAFVFLQQESFIWFSFPFKYLNPIKFHAPLIFGQFIFAPFIFAQLNNSYIHARIISTH